MTVYVPARLLQSCATLCNPKDYCSPSGSSVHGILQARILEWVTMPSSRGSSWSRYQTHLCLLCLLHWHVGSLPLLLPGRPWHFHYFVFDIMARMPGAGTNKLREWLLEAWNQWWSTGNKVEMPWQSVKEVKTLKEVSIWMYLCNARELSCWLCSLGRPRRHFLH